MEKGKNLDDLSIWNRFANEVRQHLILPKNAVGQNEASGKRNYESRSFITRNQHIQYFVN